MIRPTTLALLLSFVTAAALVGCSSPAHRAEGRLVFTTIGPTEGQSTDVALGTPDGGVTDDQDAADPADPAGEVGAVRMIDVTSAPSALDIASRNGGMSVKVDPAATGLTITAALRCGGSTPMQAKSRLAEATVDIEEMADGVLRVRPVMPGGWKNGDGASFEITLPSAPAVTARSSNGSIRLDGCQGPIDVDTSNGRLTFIGTDGDVVAETSNGRIILQDTVGDVQARSSNGRVIVENHLGALSIRTSNGSMNIELHEESDAPVVARTSNGAIDLSVGAGFGGWLRANTSNGSVSLDGAPQTEGPLSIASRSMRVKLVGDDDESTLDSSNGRVRVVVRQ